MLLGGPGVWPPACISCTPAECLHVNTRLSVLANWGNRTNPTEEQAAQTDRSSGFCCTCRDRRNRSRGPTRSTGSP